MNQTFDIYGSDLSGIKLIEASAGTGKTYTLAGLYLRYIVEQNLLPEQILVLTFTNAATLELKNRLRLQLIECRDFILYQQQVEDPKLLEIYQKYASQTNAIKSIELAIACFDQAAIFTINGFCQKIIDDYNSLCGAPVFKELIDKRTYIEQYVYQFWRIQQKTTPLELLNAIPPLDQIVNKLASLLSKSHYKEIKPLFEWYDVNQLYQKYKQIYTDWQQQQADIIDYMHSGNFGRKFTTKSPQKYLDSMSEYLQNFKVSSPNFVERFRSSFLQKESKSDDMPKMPQFCIDFDDFYDQIDNLGLSFLYACWNFVKQQLHTLLTEQGKYGYDDQINVVHQALNNQSMLVKPIAEQYQCVMVDEFQDTDAQQLEIFQRCFFDSNHSVIFVGDPKQAIYEFRGADVFVYQKAKQQINQHFSLNTNWRSSETMLAASNGLFDFENSFQLPWIKFQTSKTKPVHKQKLLEETAPVSIIDIPDSQRLGAIANEIKRLISSVKIQDNESKRLIQEQDIAILVNKNQEAQVVYDFLLSQNLKVSLWSDVGVFATEMAKQLYYLLRAIDRPNQTHLFTTLHGCFFNISLNELNQTDIEPWIQEFISYKVSSNKGIYQNLDTIFNQQNIYANLLKRVDGERVYTDLVQLLELLQQKEGQGFNLNQILQWLAEEIKQGSLENNEDERKRRLESDGHKISILTMHKSKGLEFNLVFIPYAEKVKASTAGKGLKAVNAIHDELHNGVISWQVSAENVEIYNQEKQAETIRLLYVAITRAKHRLYLGLDSEPKSFEKTPIFKLLENIQDREDLQQNLKLDSYESKEIIKEYQTQLNSSEFNRDIEQAQSIYSFSYLAKNQGSHHQQQNEVIDEIDYNNYFHFPKGSKSGTMQHEIFENIDFDAELPTIQIEVEKLLKTYDFEPKWKKCLSQQVKLILDTELSKEGIKLSKLKNTIDEMEFLLPVGKINQQMIGNWLSNHRGVTTQFQQENLKGFLTGFIDLVFENEGKFYVLDYKSNHLGSSFEDYSKSNLTAAIAEHYYDLQYLLYSVALIKYLQIHLKDFNYQQHFGGVLYLFTRGVNGETGHGVYQNKPNEKLIEQMLEAFT